jgi:GH15 family glucan-1,4-alpha-glucosidase
MADDFGGGHGDPERRIEDYALIGNMLSAALVGYDGSIDWLCLPRFDSPACFAALLGDAGNGRWKIAPTGEVMRRSRCYLTDTAVLETRFETETGAVTLTDFMPLSDDEEKIDLVRIVTGVEGEVEMEMELALRFEYGKAVPWVRRRDYGLSAIAGPDAIELHTRLPLRGENMTTCSRFTVAKGDSVPLTLSYHRSHRQPHFVADRHESLDRTLSWWREWVKRGSFEGMPDNWRDPVVRSLITLKMLIHAPTGGIVAAPTTSLPEAIGGERNWDYRYCWLRDSALTLYALLNAGYRDEAEAWRQWLLRAVAGHPQQLQIMYGIAGERWLPEFEVPWLAGYEESRPVRVGNAAAGQTQLDVYGELLDTLHAAREAELQPQQEAWRLQRVLLDHLEKNWQTLDRGIWEVRGDPRAFTHSRMMAWVAFERAIASAERFDLDGPVDRWKQVRGAIHDDICAHGFSKEKNSFVQYYGGDALDASLLLMPQVGFLPPDDPRVTGTIAAIERELMRDGFVLRYSTHETDDGLAGEEGAFLACSFWLADAYVLCGRHDDARTLFDRLLSLRNDLGLLAEEYDPRSKRLVGNFPQAFSHIGLINTAHNLVEAKGPAQQRAQQTAPRETKKVATER